MPKRVMQCAAFVAMVTAGAGAWASEDAIETRQNIMENVGAAMQVAGNTARGEIAFDPVAVELALRTMNSSIIGFIHYFPEGSHEGDTRAEPEIWEEMENFLERAAVMREATATAIAAEPQDVDSLRAVFGDIADACGDCHEPYRVPED